MMLFNKMFTNLKITKKKFKIKAVETNPNQKETAKDIDIKDIDILLTLSQEHQDTNIIATIQANDKEYSFILYDEIIDYINKIKGGKNNAN